MKPLKPLTADGVTYDIKAVEQLREVLIAMRDDLLKDNHFPAAVTFSHIIAVLAYHRDNLMKPSELVREVQEQNRVLTVALATSLRLQSHYAKLLNQHDGGLRLEFKTIDEWLDRLESYLQANETDNKTN